MRTGSWSAAPPGGASEKFLSNALGVEAITAGLLAARGFTLPSQCLEFFSPSIESLGDPFAMKGIEAAAGLIRGAVSSGKKILVYGDYDVDGITASAILVRSLKAEGADAGFYLPHRISEGYGLNEAAVSRAAAEGAGLIVTADCGINSFKEIILARRLGIELVVTDHHEQDSVALPPAAAVVNPRQSACGYPYKFLSGAGVAFKLASALSGIEKASEYLDLAALGSVADSVPLTGENRVIVKLGIQALSRTKKPGLQSLMETSGLGGRELTVRDLSFTLIPRLNAPGRMDSAAAAMELLLTDDPRAACSLAEAVEQDNMRRRRIQKTMLESAGDKLKDVREEPVIALADDNWHPGLIGIIASRISEMYSRPAVLISSASGICRGSARCGENFHILSALNGCKKLLNGLGGHSKAAGFSIERRNIPRFLKKIRAGAPGASCPRSAPLTADREVNFAEISMKLLEELRKFQPFGHGNPEPVFSAREVEFRNMRRVKNGHLKMTAAQGKSSFNCIGFGMYDGAFAAARSGDMLFYPETNLWNGKREIQLVLKSLGIRREG